MVNSSESDSRGMWQYLLATAKEPLKNQILSKYFKIQGLQDLTLVQDSRALLREDRRQARRYFEEFLPGGGADVEDEDTVIADNITISKPGGSALPWLLVAALTGLLGAGAAMYWPRTPATPVDTDSTMELEIYRPEGQVPSGR